MGNDGAIYEGRGLDYEGATAKGWNTRCLGVAFIGKYVDKDPSPDALDVAKSYLQYLVDKSKYNYVVIKIEYKWSDINSNKFVFVLSILAQHWLFVIIWNHHGELYCWNCILDVLFGL